MLLYSDKTYEYDDEMRIIKVLESGNETASYTYDANGNKASETLANGVVSTYSYNNANRITKLVTKSGETTISEYEYSYYLDGSDSCKIRKENGIIETTSYEYDNLKRLTQETISRGSTVVDTYSYEYDDYGNRSKMTASGTADYTTVYDYNDADGNYTTLLQKEIKTVESEAETTSASVLASNPAELLNAVSSGSETEETVYTYDANGNQVTKTTSEKTETYTYDALNQLVGFIDGDTAASYAYNVSGLRIEKTVDGETINHVWDGSQQIIADVVDNDFYEADCYLRGTNLVAKYNYCNGVKSEYTYYTQNAHGDVVNLTDETGAVTKSYTYDAFGVEQNIDDSDTNAFRYCGEYFDAETGTVYLRARYYDSTIGRFITRDTVTGENIDPLSLNLYTYCHNNPMLGVDPSGHIFMLVTAAIGAAAGAVIGGVVAASKGESVLKGALIGGAIGGAVGLGAGAVAAGALAGSFAASTGAVVAGASTVGTTVATSGLAAGAGMMATNFSNAINNAGQTLVNTFNNVVSRFQKPIPEENVYYQVTSHQSAEAIQKSQTLVPSTIEKSVCVLNYQPTLNQAKSIGAQSYETVIRFTSNCSTFIKDETVGTGAFRNMIDGSVNVSNVTEVGFRTFWDIFK